MKVHSIPRTHLIFWGLLFCLTAQANREINAVIPVLGFRSPSYDTIVWITLSNPSTVAQSAQLTVNATGNFYVSLDYDSSGTLPGKSMALLGNFSGGYNHSVAFTSSSNCNGKSCEDFAAGEARVLMFRVRNSNGAATAPGGGQHDYNTAVTLKIVVQGNSGFMQATGAYQMEMYDGVAYVGGSFPINSGKPF